MSILPAFTLDFNHTVLPGLVTVGTFDGRTPMLACGTTGGRAFLHTGGAGYASTQVRFLNINRDITALSKARLVRGGGSGALGGASGAAAAAAAAASAWDLLDEGLQPPAAAAAAAAAAAGRPRHPYRRRRKADYRPRLQALPVR